MTNTATAYQRHKERARARAARQSAAGRDIGQLPPVADPHRKARGRRDFRAFCETYLSDRFGLAWSDDHLHAIARIEDAVLRGGLFALAMPRGSGKTTLAEAAVLWALVYGHRAFVVLIGADEAHAIGMLLTIKQDMETNDLLAADFPEVCVPVQALGGMVNKQKGQLYQGRRTRITWTDKEIVLPTIPGSPAAGACCRVRGITGRLRGMKHKARRPSLVIVDDPQTDESANSSSQVERRLSILMGAVLGLAGPGKKIAGIMPCTVIAPDDLADRILDQDRYPQWQGHRTKLLYAFPTNEKLWEEYARIRAEGLRAGRGLHDATAFYLRNRAEMDAGAQVAWPARYNPDEASATQHAMNLYLQSPGTFHAEYQNEPQRQKGEVDDLTAEQIAGKLNGLKRYELPQSADHLVAYIDVQQSALFYSTLAVSKDFTGCVPDYGCFPDQKRRYYTLNDLRYTLQKQFPQAIGLGGQLHAGLEALVEQLLGREYPRADGAAMRVSRILIDANWGQSTDLVYQFCRQSKHAALLLPAHGRFVGPASRPFSEYRKQDGDLVGLHWRMPSVKGKRAIRHVQIDTNFWKAMGHDRLRGMPGDRGTIGLWGDDPDQHRCFADHLVSETRKRLTHNNRTVDIFTLPPNKPDNHWLDCYTGCLVAASLAGCELSAPAAATPQKAKPRRRVYYFH